MIYFRETTIMMLVNVNLSVGITELPGCTSQQSSQYFLSCIMAIWEKLPLKKFELHIEIRMYVAWRTVIFNCKSRTVDFPQRTRFR